MISYLHEQLHWLLAGRRGDRGIAAALRQVESRYPGPPGRDEGGAASTESTWLHLLLCALQVDVLSALIGASRTQATVARLASAGIYPWVYQTVTRDLASLLEACDRAALREP